MAPPADVASVVFPTVWGLAPPGKAAKETPFTTTAVPLNVKARSSVRVVLTSVSPESVVAGASDIDEAAAIAGSVATAAAAMQARKRFVFMTANFSFRNVRPDSPELPGPRMPKPHQ